MHLMLTALCPKNQFLCAAEVLERGKTHTVQLSSHMLGGRESWLRWHRRFAEVLSPKLEQARPTP